MRTVFGMVAVVVFVVVDVAVDVAVFGSRCY